MKHHDTLGAVALIGIVVIILSLALMEHCGNEQHVPNTDSLRLALEITKRQHGREIASLLNDLSASDKVTRKQRDQIDSLKARSKSVVTYYSNEIKRLRSVAPINCTPYIDSVDMECAKVVNAKDYIIGGQLELINSLDSARIVLDSIVSKQSEVIKMDSVIIAGADKAVKKAERKAKRAKVLNKVLLFTAAAYTGVVMYLTVVK